MGRSGIHVRQDGREATYREGIGSTSRWSEPGVAGWRRCTTTEPGPAGSVRHLPPRRPDRDVLVHETFTAKDKAYIESRDMFFLATADEHGRPNVSYKGGDPGSSAWSTTTRSRSRATTATGCTCRWATCSKNPSVASCSSTSRARPDARERRRVDRLRRRAPRLVAEAQFVVRVRARIFPNCPRYVHRYEKVAPSVFVPARTARRPCPRGNEDWASTCSGGRSRPRPGRDGGVTWRR